VCVCVYMRDRGRRSQEREAVMQTGRAQWLLICQIGPLSQSLTAKSKSHKAHSAKLVHEGAK